jgi:hypothetical protein
VIACIITMALSAQAAKWGYVRAITIENTGSQATDAVVQIQLNNFDYSKTTTGGADIRFAIKAGNFAGAGLSYWIEQWNDNGASTIWVKIPKLAAGKNSIYLYYGNTDAKAVSDGNATFLFFDDFESGDYTKKWTNVSIEKVTEQGGILKLRGFDNKLGAINANFDLKGKMIVRTLYQREGADEHWTAAGIGGWDHWFCFGDHTEVALTGTNWVMLYTGTSINKVDEAPLVKIANKKITANWRKAAYWYDGTNLNGKQDDVTATIPTPDASSKLALRTLDNDQWDNFAYVTVSPYTGPEPAVTIGDEKKIR